MNYENFFPFPSIRQEQKTAIEFTLKQFESGKKIVILEMGTGCGKSGVAICVSKYLHANRWNKDSVDKMHEPGSWILTTQKILQDQYIKDFGEPKNTMCSVKSASNYQCKFFKKNNCVESLNLLKEADQESKFFKTCQFNCVYRQAKRDFLSSDLSTTNFSYFLNFTTANRTISVHKSKNIVPRDLLVIDECHTIEDELSKHIEVSVNEMFSFRTFGIKFPDDLTTQYKAYKWIQSVYVPKIEEKLEDLRSTLSSLQKNEEETEEIKRINENIERLSSHQTKVKTFLILYDKDNWVFNLVENPKTNFNKIEFKPVDIGEYAHDYLFRYGNKVLMMSATVLNKEAFCESIGVNPNDAAFISIESPFPIENRPIIYIPVGKMDKNSIQTTLPKQKEVIEALLEDHEGEKGLLHSRTYEITNYILKNIKTNRFITHENYNRDEIIKEFMNSTTDLVLVSPSSTEGLDLKGDLARFQIISKIYWPYLGDKLVKRRMKKYKRWYAYQAAKSIVQAVGRAIRTQDDYAVTYILDGSWEYFYYKNKDLFPEYFIKSLHMD